MIVCLNGQFLKAEEAKISIFDHALLYGDGVFDTIAAIGGKIIWLEEHIDRLLAGCESLQIRSLWSRAQLIDFATKTFALNETSDARIRVMITRGEGEIPMSAVASCRPNLIIFCSGLQALPSRIYQEGMRLGTLRDCRRIWPQVKNLSFIASVIGTLEASRAGVDDMIFLDDKDHILEGTTFNIFAVTGGKIRTPAEGILLGVTRGKVIEQARGVGFTVEEGELPLVEALQADEVFITGTTKRIVPVVEIDRQKIGDGTVGRITRRLMAFFSEFPF